MIQYNTLGKYSWDETSEHVKIYVDLEGIQTLPNDKIEVNFGRQSCDIKIHQLNNKNFRFGIPKLQEEIDQIGSIFRTRTNRFIITLKKKKNGLWGSLHWKENTLSKSSTPSNNNSADSNEDPSKSIMNLMKNMYEEGDDEMKRTIAKAWTESQSKQGKMF